ncbi:SCAN domain-containing protein 3 [Trichonephila clavipes]|nr:SCAN domain-containing protein 3 [Trichonephila clavipes]
MTSTKKQRTEEEHREFNRDWTELFAFMCNSGDLPTSLIYQEELAHNKKSSLERNFITKHTQFASKYPTGEERIKAVDELQKQNQQPSSMLSNWTQCISNVNLTSFVVSLEIAKSFKSGITSLKNKPAITITTSQEVKHRICRPGISDIRERGQKLESSNDGSQLQSELYSHCLSSQKAWKSMSPQTLRQQ